MSAQNDAQKAQNLDRWLAKKLRITTRYNSDDVPLSRDWKGAGRVVEAMVERAGSWQQVREDEWLPPLLWTRFCDALVGQLCPDEHRPLETVLYRLSPEAIALAARAALEAEEGGD